MNNPNVSCKSYRKGVISLSSKLQQILRDFWKEKRQDEATGTDKRC